MVSAPNIPKYSKFSFSPSILIFSWIVSSIPSEFSSFHYEHGTFFDAKFYSYILTVYTYRLYYGFQHFFIFCKQFDVVHVH